MLFDSSLKQELNRSFGATLVVLVTVVMTMVLIRTLGLASNGNVNPAEVSLVLALAGVWIRHHQWSWRHWLPARSLARSTP